MNTARRWYMYLVCAISLQSGVWAVIALLRNLLAGGKGTIAFIAFQIAVIVIAVPIFLIHWLWAQRLADRDVSEREASLRRIYLYGMLAGFLGPIIANAYDMIAWLLWIAVGKPGLDSPNSYWDSPSPTQSILQNLIAIIVLTLLWFYQKQVISADAKTAPEVEDSAATRRLYMFVFSAWGLTMTTLGIVHVIRWIMFQFGGSASVIEGWGLGVLTDEVARLIVGVPLWLIFWRQAQSLFHGPSEAEHESALRKFYLYAAVFVGVLSAVTNATIILAGFFRRILSLPSQGDIRTPLPLVLGMILLWAFHAYILRNDEAATSESPRQAEIRRQYLYLVALIGLAAFLVGFSGDISVLIRSTSQSFLAALKEQLAWFTAALIAGLPVWLLPWRQAQLNATAMTPAGADERRSTIRKNYLYFFIFIATMAVLSSAVYILYRLLALALGEPGRGNLLSGLGQAIAYAVVGIGVWLYHGSVLRGDGETGHRERALRLKDIYIAIMDAGNAGLGELILSKLKLEEPSLNFDLISMPSAGDHEATQAIQTKLSKAGLIVTPWSITVADGTGDGVNAEVAHAVIASPARKILIPAYIEGWDWAGIDRWNVETLVLHTVRSVMQWVNGEEIKPPRPIGLGASILRTVGVIILVIIVAVVVLAFFNGGF